MCCGRSYNCAFRRLAYDNPRSDKLIRIAFCFTLGGSISGEYSLTVRGNVPGMGLLTDCLSCPQAHDYRFCARTGERNVERKWRSNRCSSFFSNAKFHLECRGGHGLPIFLSGAMLRIFGPGSGRSQDWRASMMGIGSGAGLAVILFGS